MTKEYDLVVLGGGTGGYVAAIRASQLGMKVAVVEAKKLGGTCLHSGCIPTKTLLRTAEIYREATLAKNYGIDLKVKGIDFSKVQAKKESIIKQLHSGIEQLFKKHQIDLYNGYGRILGPSIFSPLPGTISVEYESGEENTMLVPTNVLIATGSKPREINELQTDGNHILNSDQALKLTKLPKSILIIGGGIIGIEWASLLVDLGVKVTVIESEASILQNEDEIVQREVTKQLKKRGVKIVTNASIDTKSLQKEEELVSLAVNNTEDREIFTAEKILVAIGREPNINDIGLQNTNVERENNFIKTNEVYQTKDSHIYAIGDCVGGLQLAHVAQEEAIIAVEHMAGKEPITFKSNQVPVNIYSYPEVGKIGLTEKEAKKAYENISVGIFPFAGIGKAHVNGEVNGFVKVITDEKTDDLLGIHIVGDKATELIGEASVAKFLDASGWELSKVIHAHPSLAEIFKEAALATKGNQIHG